MKTYQVAIVADFLTKSSSPQTIREKLQSMILARGFEERNFEISISRLPTSKGGEVEPTPKTKVKRIVKSKPATKTSHRKSRRQSQT